MIKELELEQKWNLVQARLKTLFGKAPDVNGALFLIGIHELGKGPQAFTKEEKQDLMHIANCKVLSLSGFYVLEGLDEDGWPHWRKAKPLPNLTLDEQENLLKLHIIEYLEQEAGL